MFSLKNKSLLSRIVLNQTDYTRQRYTWSEETRTWKLLTFVPNEYCDKYGLCGTNGNCDSTQLPACQCLKGFKPKSPGGWSSGDWSQGCVRNKPLNCQAGDGFIQFGTLKLPDATHSWVNKTMSLKECRGKCLQNCSCMAYTSLDIRGRGSGCVIWFGDLVDIRQFQFGGQDLFIRMSALELGYGKKQVVIIVISVMLTGMVVIGLLCYIWIKRRRKQGGGENEEMELPIFDLTTIVKATDNFSSDNMLGQGGFGPVYKIMFGKVGVMSF
ncbi:hypothetical protein SLEP1_g52928 [Rubroshorea leprosula]|uniref:Apple domain-containing protein n=1 Tax=Rubroshorea leprosula TaxID=152421 RepID=A0AAV5M7Z0_9ROSI|nr:hypothetical protein SLEP1_g52928 [Rubroshorea leprosula]